MEVGAGIERKGAAYVGPGEGRAVWVSGGQLLTYKVTAEQTGGAYSLFEDTVPPRYGTPTHIHHREDESFYIVEGEFEFSRDGETIRAGAGSLVYVPRGSLHAFKNVGEGRGRLLMSQTPGGLHERFFEEVGEEAIDRTTPPATTDRPDLAAVAAKYGTEMAVPPRS
ncbi:MAG TPA: cupin domain-containing protein [Rubrobacter sp.]|nr:cupin domain-containing protein [Rubrobacter sp.]